MASTLPIIDPCCTTQCTTSSSTQIPGPPGEQGPPGTDGAPGASGKNAYTTLTAQFTMPAEQALGQATVVNTAWMVPGQIIYVQTLGYLRISSVDSSTLVTLLNLEDAGTFAYLINAASGTIAAIGVRVGPGGEQGPGTGGGTNQVFIDYHLTSTPPTDPTKAAFSYPAAGGTVFQWIIGTQNWI